MRNYSLAAGTALLLCIAAGCASTKQGQTPRPTARAKGELLYLICENRAAEGAAPAQKVCWEPTESESPTAKKESLVLYCEQQPVKDSSPTDKVCKKIEGVDCEVGKELGSNIAVVSCTYSTDKKLREIRDQYELEKSRMQSK